MREQVVDGDREIMIGRQQSRAPGDDPVPVVIGVARDGEVEAILQTDQPLHRVGRRRVHPDAPVPVHRHEPERRIDGLADDRQVQAVALGDRGPVVDAGPAERIDAQAEGRAANRLHVDHPAEIAHVGAEIVVPMRRGGAQRPPTGTRFTPWRPHFRSALASASIQRVTSVSAGPPCGGLYLNPPSSGGLCDGRDDNAVGQAGGPPAIVGEDGVRHRGSRRVFVVLRQHDVHAVGGQYLEGTGARRHRQRVRVDAEEQRPVDAPLRAVAADGLRDGEDVPFVEGLQERGPPMPRGTEGDLLPGDRGIRHLGVVGADQSRHVDQQRGRSRLAGQRADLHGACTRAKIAAHSR